MSELSSHELEELVKVLYHDWLAQALVCPVCKAQIYGGGHRPDCLLKRWIEGQEEYKR